MQYLRTSDLAKAVGVHPNTVRRYVDRGLLPPVEHSPSGYRRFTRRHLDCLRLAKLSINREFASSRPPSAATWEARWSLPTVTWHSCNQSVPRPTPPPVCSSAGPLVRPPTPPSSRSRLGR